MKANAADIRILFDAITKANQEMLWLEASKLKKRRA